MTSPDQRNDIAHLDFAIGCQIKGCTAEARFFTEWHMTGACTHPALNSAGNIERWLCDDHTHKAISEAEKRSERPFWWQWFNPLPPKCCTCGRNIQTPGDILQIVRPL